MAEYSVFPAPPHSFRQFGGGRTERLLGWDESGNEVYARTPFSDGEGAPEVTTWETMPCQPGWVAVTFYGGKEPPDLEADANLGPSWRVNKYPIVGWSIKTESFGYGRKNPNSHSIIREVKPIIPDITDDYRADDFGDRVAAYITPEGKVYSWDDSGLGHEALSLEDWLDMKMKGIARG